MLRQAPNVRRSLVRVGVSHDTIFIFLISITDSWLLVLFSEEETCHQNGKPFTPISLMSSNYYYYFHTLLMPSKDLTRPCVLFSTTHTLFLSNFYVFAYLVFCALALGPSFLVHILLFESVGSRDIFLSLDINLDFFSLGTAQWRSGRCIGLSSLFLVNFSKIYMAFWWTWKWIWMTLLKAILF